MLTLVVSDLHLGARGGRARLHDAAALERLTAAVAGADRLVLLGDVVELRQGPVREAFAAALPILTAVGEALGPAGEVVLIPGNHDHHLLDCWSARRAATGPAQGGLGLSTEIDWVTDEPLAALAAALGAGGATVSARYPGIWLRDDVYAMHGHYLDRHTTMPILERLSAGANARVLRAAVVGLARAEEYEAALAPTYAWIHAITRARGAVVPLAEAVTEPGEAGSMRIWQALEGERRAPALRRYALGAGLHAVVLALNRLGIGPVRADLSSAALRRSSLVAFGAVLSSLSVRASYAVFGHSHRAGPLPGDDQGEWTAPTGVRMLNSGCWVHEPDFLGRSPATSPYRAGFAVIIDGAEPPRLVNLLDGG